MQDLLLHNNEEENNLLLSIDGVSVKSYFIIL